MAHLDASDTPSIPTRTYHNITKHTPRSRKPAPSVPSGGKPKNKNIQATSPEVISNLISSLSAISQPAADHFDNLGGSASAPATPGLGQFPVDSAPAVEQTVTKGSFGVDYGAYTQPGLQAQDSTVSLDELSASSPVIRTAPPPSGLSSLTAPRSPRHSGRSLSRDSSGFRSFIRASTASRPSSNDGSILSKNDDANSVGKISIERGSAPIIELKRQRSVDSWAKKTGSRSTRNLMYMSSKERLRGRETSSGSIGSATGLGIGQRSSSQDGVDDGRAELTLAEDAISEEPHSTDGTMTGDQPSKSDRHRRVPVRESSLKKAELSTHRSSARRSRKTADMILTEEDDQANGYSSKRRSAALDPSYQAGTKSFLLDEYDSSSKTSALARQQILQSTDVHEAIVESSTTGPDEAAPFPVLSQNRRRAELSAVQEARLFAGLPSPPPDVPPKPSKRSSFSNRRVSSQNDRMSTEERNRTTSPAPTTAYERPGSADSIDDAVGSYLCSPRLSQKIKHPQTGRVISFSEVGDPNGSAVFCCVGMGLTRYITAFYDELALTLKLRLITPDRPGVGGSEPYSEGTTVPLNWPDDVYSICQALKITKFSILAHSAGAIYALATALRMPQHIRGRIHLLAPWIPPSQMSSWGGSQEIPPTNAIPTSQRVLRALPTPLLKAVNSSFMSATSASITSSLPKEKRKKRKSATQGERQGKNSTATPSASQPDKETVSNALAGDHVERRPLSRGQTTSPAELDVPAREEEVTVESAEVDKERQVTYDTRLTHAIWDLATTNANPAVDLLICLERQHTIGFRYVDISRPVVIHHGSRDTRVPVENVRWLGKTMRRCEVRVLEGEGHGLMASAGVMGAVLMEISKEWDDWIKVTGGGRKRSS